MRARCSLQQSSGFVNRRNLPRALFYEEEDTCHMRRRIHVI
jgi:hypothetical protein